MRFSALCLLLCFFVGSLAKSQNVTVKGIAACNKLRINNVHISLMEKNFLTRDDTLAEVVTKDYKEFQLFGEDDEVLSIQPYLIFNHTCNVKKPGCYRLTKYEIPQNYIGGVYNMTYVTLDIIQYEDKQFC